MTHDERCLPEGDPRSHNTPLHVIHNTIAWERHHIFGIIAHNNNYHIWCQVEFNALIATAGLSLF